MHRFLCTYRVRAPRGQVAAIADAIALEQSVEVPRAAVHDPVLAERIVGRVAEIRERADGDHDVVIALATETVGGDIAQFFNMAFGNTAMHPHVEWTDVALPDDLLALFPGPRFGSAGLRSATGAHGRPLTCSALKPQGQDVAALAALCATFAQAGVDVIKDDHGIADQAYSPFAERVAACQRAIDRVATDTGHRALYAPSVVGAPRVVAQRIRAAQDEGVGAVLLAPALLGLPAFAEFVRDDVHVPVLAHPSFAGAARVAPPLMLGTLFRLLGADAVIFPHYAGRFAYSQQACADIAARARAPLGAHVAAMPVPAGGVQLDGVDDALAYYGTDTMVLIGGSLLIERDRIGERTRRFVDAVRGAAQVAGATA
ncbi:MAG: ribulose 1,5-bisphosphate carboxylase [Proteobacteria bacterium]|nr:ribulose 1,5-bisphosphate carboxylase [Pseudomonadota bacterium]